MSWSLGEVRALCLKAARGGGLSWGLAEEAGFAVSWLEARGLPGAAALLALLEEEGADAGGQDCPFRLGAWLSDCGTVPAGDLGHVRQPLLLAPFIARTLDGSAGILTFAGCALHLSAYQARLEEGSYGGLCARAGCRFEPGAAMPDSPSLLERAGEERAAVITGLSVWAGRTYAPATEQSRLAGAGAGLTDND